MKPAVVRGTDCTERSHRHGTPFTYAYDFLMPIDLVTVQHEDGTVLVYSHLTLQGLSWRSATV